MTACQIQKKESPSNSLIAKVDLKIISYKYVQHDLLKHIGIALLPSVCCLSVLLEVNLPLHQVVDLVPAGSAPREAIKKGETLDIGQTGGRGG